VIKWSRRWSSSAATGSRAEWRSTAPRKSSKSNCSTPASTIPCARASLASTSRSTASSSCARSAWDTCLGRTGQSREMVEHYARQVNQRRLAAAAILKWETADAARATRKQEGGFVQPAPEFVQHDRPQTSNSLRTLVPPRGLEPRTPRSTNRMRVSDCKAHFHFSRFVHAMA